MHGVEYGAQHRNDEELEAQAQVSNQYSVISGQLSAPGTIWSRSMLLARQIYSTK